MDSLREKLFEINEAILNPLIILMFAVATAVFIWGLVKFIARAGEEAERTTGKKNMVWGLVGMFIMISVYGILNLSLGTFGLQLG